MRFMKPVMAMAAVGITMLTMLKMRARRRANGKRQRRGLRRTR